jgi:tyrosine-protein phosphatase SIW14
MLIFPNPSTTNDPNNTKNNNEEPEELIPMENFSMVCKGVYRGAFPKKKNFPFLKKLGLKSILTLILEEYSEQNMKFLNENNIKLFQFGVAGNKEPFVDIPEDTIRAALSVLLDKRNHPIFVHCNKGKHRTGCLIGCLRKVQYWSHTSIFDEYRRFSHPKSRSMDQQFIELFDPRKVVVNKRYLPDWPELNLSSLTTTTSSSTTTENNENNENTEDTKNDENTENNGNNENNNEEEKKQHKQ